MTISPAPNRWRLRRVPLGIAIGFALAGAILVLAIAAPSVVPFDPMRMGVGPRLAPPSQRFPFGTDEFGRDLLSRVLMGARLSLMMGSCAVAGGLVIGALTGLIAALGGKIAEAVLLRVVDILYSFPDILVALALVAFLGPGIVNASIAIAISLVPIFARVTYGLAAAERAKPYVAAALLAGNRQGRLARVHIVPNIGQSVLVVAMLGFSSAILSSAGLSFLGLGVQPPSPEWGAILASGRTYMTKAPWILLFPGLAICLTALAMSLIADGLRDITGPRGRSR